MCLDRGHPEHHHADQAQSTPDEFRARKSAMAFAKQYALAPKAAMLQIIKVNMLST